MRAGWPADQALFGMAATGGCLKIAGPKRGLELLRPKQGNLEGGRRGGGGCPIAPGVIGCGGEQQEVCRENKKWRRR